MSTASSLADYRDALRTPGAGLPVLASIVGRFPIAMGGLALLLYVQQRTGSFAAAGLVGAAAIAGVSIGEVAQGRIMDRYGPTRPLLVVVGVFLVAQAGVVTAVETGAPLAVLTVLALLGGLSRPAVEGASRALWSRLLPPGPRRDAAFSYEALSLEVFFVLGPALAVFLALAPWPGLGVAVAAAASLVGTAAFALSAPVRGHRPARADRPAVGLIGVMARPGMRTVALGSLGFGVAVGTVEVAVPAYTTIIGVPVLGGLLLSAWSIVSVLAGVLYSLRPWPRALHLRPPVLLGALSVGIAAMALAGPTGSVVVLAGAMLLAGAAIAPLLTTQSLVVGQVTPPGVATEAFGWTVTAATLGIAAGQSGGGLLIEAGGPTTPLLAGGAAGLALAAVLWLRRDTLRPAVPVDAAVRTPTA